MEPIGVEPGGQGQAVVAGLGPLRVEPELPGVVPRAEEPGVLARPGERPLDQPERQGHAVGDAVAPAAGAGRARPRSRGSRRARRPGRGRWPPAGSTTWPVRTRWTASRWFPSGCAIDRTIASLSGPRRQAGQVLADPDAGDRRVDRLELAPDAVGRLGLHVERVVLAEPAAEQDHDHRLRPARRRAAGRRRPGRQQARQAQPQQPRIAHLEERPPRVERAPPSPSIPAMERALRRDRVDRLHRV